MQTLLVLRPVHLSLLLVASSLVVVSSSCQAQSLPKEQVASQDQLDARDALNKGVEAFKSA